MQLTPTEQDFQLIQDMGIKMGLLTKHIPLTDLIDSDFIPQNIEPAAIDVTKIPASK